MTSVTNREGGGVSVVLVGVLGVVAVLAGVVGEAGTLVVARHRAAGAADLAALAAVDGGCALAAGTAAQNGAAMIGCAVQRDGSVVVGVRVVPRGGWPTVDVDARAGRPP